MKQLIPLFFAIVLSSGVFSQGQDWNLLGNSVSQSNVLGTQNNSPLNIYTNGQQRMIVTNEGRIGYRTTTPNYQFQLHSEMAGLAFADDKGGEVYGPIGTQSILQITNQESGSSAGDGLLIGMTGNTAFMRSTDKLRMNIQNDDAYMSFISEGRIDFFGASTLPTDARVNLFSGTQNGFKIISNESTSNAFEVFNSNTQMVIKGDGRVGLGTDAPDAAYLLDAAGKIRACEVKVANPGWCDYVFKEDYKLMSLYEIEQFIKANSHLPEVPSEAEVEENGIDLAAMNAILLKKIEEMTLHLIAMEKRIAELESE